MATSLLATFLSLSCLFTLSFCFQTKRFDLPMAGRDWLPAGATWYGSPRGAGSEGGACGYGNAVDQAPYSAMISAGSTTIFNKGKGCGSCYQVMCTTHKACSGKPVTVVIADYSCPGTVCQRESAHFDFSGTAFGAMAKPGMADELRSAGYIYIQYSRVACEYPGRTVTFHVEHGSNPYYFAVVVEFEDGDGDLSAVEIKEGSGEWRAMRQSWGAVWRLDTSSPVHGPFSIRLTTQYSGQKLVANNVIPTGWQAGTTYRSFVNYS
ncbi:expansin-B5 isoform X3 [Elaeis guineensis]|uniref:expansin-B5 isoform X3 n=1 Tax=Elaeis guineensis var. tenera TaxID=51953 RepID=UPI003C6D63E6